jgi:hypothetical protein
LLLIVLSLSLLNCKKSFSKKRGDYGEANPPGMSLSWDRLHNVMLPHLPPNPITTNYGEMLADPSKIAITMGVPEHIDFNRNLAIPGNPYEDPVFVDEHGEEITADEATAEAEEEETNE